MLSIAGHHGDEGDNYYSLPSFGSRASQEPPQTSDPKQTADNSNFPAAPQTATSTFHSPANSASNLASGSETNIYHELEDERFPITQTQSVGYSTAQPVVLHNGHHLEVQEEGYANADTIQRYSSYK